MPEVELHVCGTIAAKLPPTPAGITVRGVVPSLREEYAAARLVVDPVPWGTGLSVKVVEGLCHGRPVVACRPAGAGEELSAVLVRPDPADFAASVQRLLVDRPLWERLAATAAADAARVFSREAAFGPLLARLEALVSARRAHPRHGGSIA